MRRLSSVLTIAMAGVLLAACGAATDQPEDAAGETGDVPADDAPAEDVPVDTPDDAAPDEDAIEVAFVYVEPVGDAAWTARHEAGREHLEATLGERVVTTVVEDVPEGPDSEAVFEDLAAQGHDLIFGTSSGYGDAMEAVSERHPEVAFEHANGAVTTDNLGTYTGAAEQTRYLEGMAAGAASGSGQLGFVAAFPTPEVVRGINAYTLGAQATQPGARVQVAWTSTWFDPDVETQAAQSLVDAGADVIGMHQSSSAAGEVAEAAEVAWTGFHADLSGEAPDGWLTATVWNWGDYYVAVAESVLDGTWEADAYIGDLADGVVELAAFGTSVDDDTRAQIETRRQEMIDGTFAVFTGPIIDASGTQRAAEGEALAPDDVRTMDWFVEGVLDDVV